MVALVAGSLLVAAPASAQRNSLLLELPQQVFSRWYGFPLSFLGSEVHRR